MTKHCIIAVSPNCWGRGSTVAEATKQLIRAGGKRKGMQLRFVLGDDRPYVNGMGDLMVADGATSFVI